VNLTNAYEHLKGGCEEEGGRLSSVGAQEQNKSQWAQTETQEVLYEHQETLL